MPLEEFIDETMAVLATDVGENSGGRVKMLRPDADRDRKAGFAV